MDASQYSWCQRDAWVFCFDAWLRPCCSAWKILELACCSLNSSEIFFLLAKVTDKSCLCAVQGRLRRGELPGASNTELPRHPWLLASALKRLHVMWRWGSNTQPVAEALHRCQYPKTEMDRNIPFSKVSSASLVPLACQEGENRPVWNSRPVS